MTLEVGDKVRFKDFGKVEKGIVKEIPEGNSKAVRVVYKCLGNWDRFEEYTSELTPIKYLTKGWI